MDRPVALETTATKVDWYHILGQFGLCWPRAFYASKAFLLCAIAAPLVWVIMAWVVPVRSISMTQVWSLSFASVVLWSPLWEELLFRGLLQGELMERGWTRCWVYGLSGANITVSLLFTVFHLWSHSPIWAALVLFPSLIFGYLRDRFDSTIPSVFTHMWYNSGYFFFIDSSQLLTQSDLQ